MNLSLELLKYVGGPIALIASFTYLSKILIEHLFSKGLEKYKSDVLLENERNKIVFEKLHAERAKIIGAVYAQLSEAEQTIESLIRPMQWAGEPTEEQKRREAIAAFNFLRKHFYSHKIYFSKNLAKEFEELLKEMVNILNGHQIFTMPNMPREHNELNKLWDDFSKNKIPPLKNNIEKEFRLIIGIDN
jgi:hypothetical protein